MRKIKVVVLLVQQLQHGFTKNAKVSPNLTVAHIYIFTMITNCISSDLTWNKHVENNCRKSWEESVNAISIKKSRNAGL